MNNIFQLDYSWDEQTNVITTNSCF